MKKHIQRTPYELAIRIAVPVLLVLLCVLTIVTISIISWNNAATDPSFDLDGLTNEARREDADVSGYLLPEFIGITASGKRNGVSASYNLVSELYHLLTPTIYRALTSAVPLTETDDAWNACTDAASSVYIRYHTELPDGILTLFAGMALGEASPTAVFTENVREMFLLPSPGGASATETVLFTRSADGYVRKYVLSVDQSAFSVSEMERFVRSYASRMVPFLFNEGRYATVGTTEPLFADEIITRDILLQKSAFIQNNSEQCDALLRIFGFNPDKLLNVHLHDNGGATYYDTQGILDLRDSVFEYVRSYADSGMEIGDLPGFGRTSEKITLADYVWAAVVLFRSIRDIDKNYTGGDADILLKSASSADGEVTLTFMYTVDNVRIAEENNAFEITFSGKKILHAQLHTIIVQSFTERTASYAEWWFVSLLPDGKTPYRNVRLVYRSDYTADTLHAQWAAEEMIEPSAESELHVPPEETEDDHGK